MQWLEAIRISGHVCSHLLWIIRISSKIFTNTRRSFNILYGLCIDCFSRIGKVIILIFHLWIATIMLRVHYHLLIRDCRCLYNRVTIQTVSPLHHLIKYCLFPWLNISLILLRNWLLILTTWIISQWKKICFGIHTLIWLRLVSLELITTCKGRLHVRIILDWTASICLGWLP